MKTSEKDQIRKNQKCYVCDQLGLPNAGFEGYSDRDIHLDHFLTPFASVGEKDKEEVLPIHGTAKGDTCDDENYDTSKSRNCHRHRSDKFRSAIDYVTYVRARRGAREASYIDDVFENEGRSLADKGIIFNVKWEPHSAVWMGKEYPLVTTTHSGETWRRFLISAPSRYLFTDHESQVRPAAPKAIHSMIRTFVVDGYPMFAPVNVRRDKCGHLVVFDGNHRLTSHALVFGVSAEVPVLIWDIEPTDQCAVAPETLTDAGSRNGASKATAKKATAKKATAKKATARSQRGRRAI